MPAPEEFKPDPLPNDPDALAKALEIELMMKRVAWQKATARRGTWRALSVLFLVLILLGALLAYFYFVPALREREKAAAEIEASDPAR